MRFRLTHKKCVRVRNCTEGAFKGGRMWDKIQGKLMLGNEAVELPDDLGIETSNQTTLCTIIYVDIYIYILF